MRFFRKRAGLRDEGLAVAVPRYTVSVRPSVSAIILLASAAWGQSLAFEVASVRPVPAITIQALRNGVRPTPRVEGNRFHAGPMTLRNLILAAYRIQGDQLQDPDWMRDRGAQNFEIDATLPTGAPPEQMAAMLQHLLNERFRLKARRETRNGDGYAVTMGRNGQRFGEKSKTESPGNSVMLGAAKVTQGAQRQTRVEAKSMVGVIDYLSSQLSPEVVVDRSGLSGTYDIQLDFPPIDERSRASSADAMRDQMLSHFRGGLERVGLRLEIAKVPIPVVIVESVDKLPTQN